MKKTIVTFVVLITMGITLLSIDVDNKGRFSALDNTNDLKELSVLDALLELDDVKPHHYLIKADQDSVRMGYEMVHFGQLKDKSNTEISKFFVCFLVFNFIFELSIKCSPL